MALVHKSQIYSKEKPGRTAEKIAGDEGADVKIVSENWGGEKRADFKREGGDGGGGPKPEGGGRRSPGVGPRAADQPGRTACRQRGSPKKPGIARALRLPLRQTSQALLLLA